MISFSCYDMRAPNGEAIHITPPEWGVVTGISVMYMLISAWGNLSFGVPR